MLGHITSPVAVVLYVDFKKERTSCGPINLADYQDTLLRKEKTHLVWDSFGVFLAACPLPRTVVPGT